MADANMAEIEDLKKKLSQNPDSLIFVPLADAYRKSGMLQEAIDVCKAGLERHPTYTSARVVLGRIYSEKEQLDEAITELKLVEKSDIDNIMVHSMLGNVYIKKKMYAEAVEQFQRVLSLNPEDAETQDKLQEALSAKQSPVPPAPAAEKPKEKPKETPEKEPEKKLDVGKSMKAAELYTKKEEFDNAIEIYREILEGDPENMIVQQRLREVYSFQDKKLKKEREKAAPPAAPKKVDADKITTEDILDVMKEAVEDDKVDEEKPAPKPAAPKPAAPKPAAPKPAAPKPAAAEAKIKIDQEKGKAVEKILKNLVEVEGVVGSFFLLRDGNIVASVLPSSINAKEIGKHIASIVDRTEQSVKTMNQGRLNQVAISSEAGQLVFTEVANGVLFLIGNENINVGKMRLILKDVMSSIKNTLS